MRTIAALAVLVGASLTAIAWSDTTDASTKAGCEVWPWATLRAPCGASFRGHAESRDIRGKGSEYEIARAGAWQRQRSAAAPGSFVYTSYVSGAAIVVGRDETGQPTFSITHEFQEPRSVPTETAETISHLGETCRVWITKGQHLGAGLRMEHQDCLTDDGVPLLHDYASDMKGTLAEKFAAGTPLLARMTRFERAAVDEAEVRPSASLFTWARWGIARGALKAGGANYEVRLEDMREGPTTGPAKAITIRKLGQIELKVEQEDSRVRKMLYRSPGRVAEFFSFNDGQPRSLTISPASGGRTAGEIRLAERTRPPAPLEKRETILGEECRWYDLLPGWADVSHHECRTSDGIPLARRETTMAWNSLIARATYLRRGAVQPKDVLPPDELIEPELWFRPRPPVKSGKHSPR